MKQFLFRVATSPPLYFFAIVLIVSIILVACLRLDSGSFVALTLGMMGVALGINKLDDAVDPKDYASFSEFVRDLPARGILVFLIVFPILIGMLCGHNLDGDIFTAAVVTASTLALASKSVGNLIHSKKSGS